MEDIIDTVYCPVTDKYYPIGRFESRMVIAKRLDYSKLRNINKYNGKPLERRLLAKV
ncbi:MAG: hypothetical protein KKA65_03200 [Nanoarchaeota archaeon]|nr:hypothetical protein [Nanoarchaeota archaeon]MBU4242452.1 hypothetical protein [Nanoarchaeota archaeon]MBU4352696.1 hypothetical protein [Nanoarchaeota archaeon]MBU4456484.1 hypothetical protein [Nanoarchaeota archaeon]MCG2720360.1 hypothetical protein [Nanoarchaeota archaeon]